MELKKLPNIFVQLSLMISLTSFSLRSQITNPAPYCASEFNWNYNMVKDINLNGTSFGLGPAGVLGPPGTLIYHNNLTFPNISIGSTATLSIGFYSPQDLEPRYYSVWIDYNQNTTFDPNELVMTNSTTNNNYLPTFAQPNVTLTINVAIPANTLPGTTRMRVVRGEDPVNPYAAYSAAVVPAACNPLNPQGNSYGCTHDFNVNFVTGVVPPVPPNPVPLPVVQFLANITNTTVNSTVILTDQSTNAPTAWKWTITPATYAFINGTGNLSQNPQVNFTAAGTYTVKLKATNAAGSDSLTKQSYITITSPAGPNGGGIKPVAQFVVLQTNTVVNSTLNFYDQSTNTPTFWKWTIFPTTYSLMNGTQNTSQNPQIKFLNNGIYTVKLKCGNGGGSDSLTKNNYIKITLTPQGNVSVNEIKASDIAFTIFPNPVKDALTIQTENEVVVKSLTLLDLSGKMVASPQLINNKINLGELLPGMYFMRVTFDDGSEIYRKIVKE